MSEPPRCWVCHRSEPEVSAFADVETPREKEIQQQTSQITRSRGDFIASADGWRKGLPKELREFEFEFVVSNADQFKPIRIGNGLLGEIAAPNKLLREISDAKKQTVDWLEDAAPVLREGDGEVPGFGALSHFEKADRELLSKMVGQFEAKWHRRIGSKGADHGGQKQGFDELKLFDGLDFMMAVGTLYYDVQAQLLDMARRREFNSKTKRSILAVPMNGYPPIPLCSVCGGLMGGLGSHAVQEAAPPMVASSSH